MDISTFDREKDKAMAQEPDRKVLDSMVDAVLDYNRTPRSHLFEYPYRADESRILINNAEILVKKILRMQNEK